MKQTVILMALLLGICNGAFSGTTISADNQLIEYTGRIDFSDKLAPKFSYSGVSIRASFTGTSISATLTDESGQNYYNIIIDGQVTKTIQLSAGQQTYLLAENLTNTTHEVEIFKRTELVFGKTQFHGFILDDNASLVKISNERPYFIEYIGNSITCGYGNEAPLGETFKAETENHYLSYAAITSHNLNARHMAVSKSGVGIYRNYNGPYSGNDDNMTNRYTRTFFDDASKEYDFAEQPDIVCINLGTNDFSTTGADVTAYKNNYLKLIQTIQSKYTNPEIVCLVGSMMSGNTLDQARTVIKEVVATAKGYNKGNVTFFEMSTQGALGFGVDYHPTVAQHEKNAGELTAYLKTILDNSSGEVETVDENLHIYLCFGQSNMEGMGDVEAQDQTVDSRFKVMQSLECYNGTAKDEWRTATPPLVNCWSGLSPADYFGRTMVENAPDGVTIGVINVAVGGCDIRLFDKDLYQNHLTTHNESWFTDKITAYGGNPYQHLIDMALKSQKDGVIKGILLHQGETNTGDANWPSYVKAIYENMLTDLSLNAEDVPLLAGQLVHEDQGGICASMNPIIDKLPETIPTAHVIPSSGCEVSSDNIHFNSAGQRELGKRYAEKMIALQSGETSEVGTVDENFHIYLCFGQSNMEGMGDVEAQDQTVDGRFKVMQSLECYNGTAKDEWRTATPPLVNCWSGLSPADYFGRTMVENAPDGVTIGVINVAVGGCDIRLFDKDLYQNHLTTHNESWFTDKITAYGGNPYQHLIDMALKAQKDGVIKGILLHQGETNTGDTNWPSYVKAIYENMLTDLSLNAEDVPLLAGQLVHEDQGGICASMNLIIDKLPETIPTAHVIPSSGCEVSSDNIHFNSAGQRELGKRYAEKMIALQTQKTATQTITLKKGWNLVSLYIQPNECTDTQPCVSAVFPNATIVKTFDSFYSSTKEPHLNSLEEIEAGKGYLVYNSIDETISLTGTQKLFDLSQINDGWNLIGVPSAESIPVEDVTGAVVIKDFDTFYQVGNEHNSLSELIPGKAYYIQK